MKTYGKCRRRRRLSSFHVDRSKKDGRTSYCKPCNRERAKAWQAAHPEAKARHQRTYEQSGRSKQVSRRSHLKRNYELTEAEFDAMVEALGGRCPGCLKIKPLCVDHCHKTGKVRGLLCRLCNSGQGQLGDDPSVLRRLADLLEASQCK